MKKVIVIGGGASGLISAIYKAKSNYQVTLLEKNNNCGKKILITGNGKCNYWNKDQSLNHYHTPNIEILKKILTKENQEEVLSFFNSIGIIPKIKEGYYYPASNQATSIQTALIKEAKLSKVEILTNEEVISLTKEKDQFLVRTTTHTLTADEVILATGSKACPKTGSTGTGYTLAKQLGHTIIEPLPALVQLKATGKFLKEWHGIRTDAKISLYEDNKYIATQIGEIQLTDYGISGICTLSLSGRVSRGLHHQHQMKIKINFLTNLSLTNENDFISWMNKRNKEVKYRTISELLDGLLNYKLVNLILKLSKINKEQTWDNLSKQEKYLLGTNLTNFNLDITGTNSFDQAQTCTGGIPLTEINPTTMESLKTKGLYLTGELLDVDGDCGGYNLGFAWLTGLIAGKNKGDNND